MGQTAMIENPFSCPVEDVLRLILDHLVDEWTRLSQVSFEVEATSLRNASQVSQYWRRVALSSAPLWGRVTDIDRNRHEWFHELITRSRESPLIIMSPPDSRLPDNEDVESNWILLSRHLWRCKILTTRVRAFMRDDGFARRMLTQPAPELEALVLCDHHFMGLGNGSPPSIEWPFFNHSAPKLRLVAIRGCAIDLRAAPFANLTSLEVNGDPGMSLQPDEWAGLLKRLSALKHLTIMHTISGAPVDVERPPVPAPDVNLPELESLRLEDYIFQCNELLSHISFPSTCSLCLKCDPMFEIHLPQEEAVLIDLPRYFTGHECQHWSVSIQSERLHVRARTGEHQIEIDVELGELLFSLSRILTLTGSTLEQLAHTAYLPISSARSLELDVHYTVQYGETRSAVQLLSCFHQITTLTLSQNAIQHIVLDILQKHPVSRLPDGTHFPPDTPIFPELRELNVKATDVSDAATPRYWAILFGFLMWRHVIRVPITDLFLTECRELANGFPANVKQDLKLVPGLAVHFVA